MNAKAEAQYCKINQIKRPSCKVINLSRQRENILHIYIFPQPLLHE